MHPILEGLFGLFKLYGCWCVCSLLLLSLLSPICCYSLAWKQDRERFHTYTHWPLINKSDQGPFPHIHATQMKTKPIHTDTDTVPNHRNVPEHTLLDLHHTCCLRGSDLATQIFVHQIRRPSDVSIAFYSLSDKCSLVAPSLNTRRFVPISCSLFCLHGMNWQVLLCGICCLICLAVMNGHIEEKSVFPWTDNLV